MARYGDLDALEKKLFPIGMVDDGRYALPAKSVKVAIDNLPTADVAPKSEEGAECPTCHGTGRIGTTDWLTKNISKKQLAEEKAQAIAEHEQHIKAEVARTFRKRMNEKMGKHTHLLGKEYVQRIMREVEKELVGEEDA